MGYKAGSRKQSYRAKVRTKGSRHTWCPRGQWCPWIKQSRPWRAGLGAQTDHPTDTSPRSRLSPQEQVLTYVGTLQR